MATFGQCINVLNYKHGYLSADMMCFEKRTVCRAGVKIEDNCELRGKDNVQRKKSVHVLEAKCRLLCLLSFKYFFKGLSVRERFNLSNTVSL